MYLFILPSFFFLSKNPLDISMGELLDRLYNYRSLWILYICAQLKSNDWGSWKCVCVIKKHVQKCGEITFAEDNGNVIGGELTLALDTDEERRAASSGGQLAREVNALEEERESALELRDHELH